MSQEPLRILLVDDELHIRRVCRAYMQSMPDVVLLGEAASIADAETLIAATQPDLVLLDIQLGDGNGFSLLKHFEHTSLQVIFITAYEQYALNALKAGAIDYLLKPLQEDEFKTAIQKAVARKELTGKKQPGSQSPLPAADLKKITISAADGLHIIRLEELIYCAASGNYTTFFLLDGRNILVSKPLKEYEALLPEQQFIRPHQSFIVNLHFVDTLTRDNTLLLKNRIIEIPVATRKREEVMKRLQG